MKIVLASNNLGKLAELQSLFAPLGVELVRQADLGVGEAEEPHRTFVENALAKARFASQHTGLPAVADDAGLCVDAFGGLPGVDTAHYATQFGYPKGDDNNVRALLEQMAGLDNRRAALVSTLVALRSPQDPESSDFRRVVVVTAEGAIRLRRIAGKRALAWLIRVMTAPLTRQRRSRVTGCALEAAHHVGTGVSPSA